MMKLWLSHFYKKDKMVVSFESINAISTKLGAPSNLSYMWNMGSLLGMSLFVQILTGFFLSMHYCSDSSLAFESVDRLMKEVNNGYKFRVWHSNGASMFFFFLYIHIGRGIYYFSYKKFLYTWIFGSIILLLSMATAFLGYVLPWGQMSYWGATVITNLFTAIPLIGEPMVMYLWGGFAVDNATLGRFYSMHFILPFLILFFVFMHLFFLHSSGSSNPFGIGDNLDKIPFSPYYIFKDYYVFMVVLCIFNEFTIVCPWVLGDPENFFLADPLKTPTHIQPEWYFLFAYAILRSIPSKLGGVVALIMSVLIILIFPFLIHNYSSISSKKFYIVVLEKSFFWIFVNLFFLLTWIGSCGVEDPYISIGQLFSFIYFYMFLMMFFFRKT